MIENINDFLSLAILIGFFLCLLVFAFNYFNGKRIKRHMQEEESYYADSDSFDNID